MTVNKGESQTFRSIPYAGWHILDVIVDGKSVGAVSSYTFEDVNSNHEIYVTYEVDDTSTTVPKSEESLEKLIDHLAGGELLDGDYDFNADGIVDGKDVILLEMFIDC